jgi:predicted outer membrane protein
MKSWLRWALASLTVLVFAAVGASAQQNKSDQNMPSGKDFITNAAQINLAEIELGNLAQQKGNNDAVRQFGKS